MDVTVLKENLEALGYDVSLFDTKEMAAGYLRSKIQNKCVGFGGSVTLEEMGLYEKLKENNEVLWHWRVPEGESVKNMRMKANAADIYISSVNAVSEAGEIVNIDGTCNRVAAMLYGHEKVYFVLGENKVEKGLEDAIARARNVAAPKNAARMSLKTPCAAKADRCYDCKSPDRICKALCVMWQKPIGGNYEVVLIKESLGY
ncbi:MAG: lactate utilization protein [Clostridia bacterium]|nr:lactate utilization protein [Clostridia bacterium]